MCGNLIEKVYGNIGKTTSKNLKKKAKELILSKNIPIANIESKSDIENILEIISFDFEEVENGRILLEIAQNIRGQEININEIKISVIPLLLSISTFLEKNKTKKSLEKFNKTLILIKKILFKHYDEVYLLYFKKLSNKKDSVENREFSAIENAKIIYSLEVLVDILNEFEYSHLSDELFILREKLKLGFLRYFFQKSQNLLLESFRPCGEFKIARGNNFYQILNIYQGFEDKFITKSLEKVKNSKKQHQFSMKSELEKLLFLKILKNKDFKERFDKNKDLLIYFPEIVSGNNFTKKISEIYKSLTQKQKINLRKIEDKNLVNTNSLKIAILTFKILENEK